MSFTQSKRKPKRWFEKLGLAIRMSWGLIDSASWARGMDSNTFSYRNTEEDEDSSPTVTIRHSIPKCSCRMRPKWYAISVPPRGMYPPTTKTFFISSPALSIRSAFKVTGEKVNTLPFYTATKNRIGQSHPQPIAPPQAATKHQLASAWV